MNFEELKNFMNEYCHRCENQACRATVMCLEDGYKQVYGPSLADINVSDDTRISSFEYHLRGYDGSKPLTDEEIAYLIREQRLDLGEK